MTMLYLDASAWVKRYERESGTEWIDALWKSRQPLACSTLGFVEVASAIARRHATRGVVAAVTKRTFDSIRRDFERFVRLEFEATIPDLAFALAVKHRLRGADAVHLASAVSYREDSKRAVVVVASDAQLLAAAQAEGFAVLDPQADPPLPTSTPEDAR